MSSIGGHHLLLGQLLPISSKSNIYRAADAEASVCVVGELPISATPFKLVYSISRPECPKPAKDEVTARVLVSSKYLQNMFKICFLLHKSE